MKISDEINQVNKITDYKSFSIINDEYITVKYIDYTSLYNFLLNNKSKEICYDDETINDIYKKITDDMDSVFNYYLNMQDKIEEMLYPRYSFYLLIINISKIYHLVDLGRFFIDKWMNDKNKIIRRIPLINNKKCNINNNDYKYIISLIDSLYKENKININDINSFDLNDYEIFNLLGLFSIVPKISGEDKSEVSSLINYVEITYNYMLKKYEEYQEKDKDNFKEKNNDI